MTDDIANIYDEVEIDDMEFEEENSTFYFPCPCGDRFRITLEQLNTGEKIAECPSCSLQIEVIYDNDYLNDFLKEQGLQHLIKSC